MRILAQESIFRERTSIRLRSNSGSRERVVEKQVLPYIENDKEEADSPEGNDRKKNKSNDRKTSKSDDRIEGMRNVGLFSTNDSVR